MTVQNMCKRFREKVLQKTLKDVSEKTGVNLKTISAFENGRSNNVNHLKIYISMCENDCDLETFFYNLKNSFKGD